MVQEPIPAGIICVLVEKNLKSSKLAPFPFGFYGERGSRAANWRKQK